jgi:CHASE3 domain sensor protein
MEKQENQLLKQQAAEAGASARYTIVTLAVGIVLTFVILCGIYSLIYQENH